MGKFISIFIILSIFTFSDGFSVIAVGDLKGEHKDLDRIYSLVSETETNRENLLKINIGNNYTGYEDINRLYEKFFSELDFGFNFLGKSEILNKAFLKEKLYYSTLNIGSEYILPYRIKDAGDKKVLVFGVSDIYENDRFTLLNHEKEIKKLIRKHEKNIDYIVGVSDLTRDENVNILMKFDEISLIIESGKLSSFEEFVKVKGRYIVPASGTMIIDFEEYAGRQKKLGIFPGKKTKKLLLGSISKIKDYSFYDRSPLFESDQEWAAVKKDKKEKEVFGYNEESFYREEVKYKESIKFLDDLSKRLKMSFNADFVSIPVKTIRADLIKGMYTRKEMENLFSADHLVKVNISSENKDNLLKSLESKKGDESYIYISGLESIEDKEEYIMITTENIQEEYDLSFFNGYEDLNIDLKQFMTKK